MWSPSVTTVLSKVRSWSTNWPRYVNPAGICPTPPFPAAIRLPSFLRIAAESCRPVPLGPSRENRNGGVTASTSGASVRGRPPAVSPSKPSPRTKKLSEPCVPMATPSYLPDPFCRSRASVTACALILQLDLLAPEEDADLVAHRADDANRICRAGLESAGITGVDVERPVFPRLLELVGRGRHPGDVVLLLRDRNRYERLSL